jgi:uncharacterized protein (UPF0332 family)
MSFDWKQYLNLAHELVGDAGYQASPEAKQRSSISRAYYAAFCKAREYLRGVPGCSIPRGPKAHQYVIDQFKLSGDRLRRKIGANLDRLRLDRNDADYENVVQALPSVVQKTLLRANDIISTLRII